MQRKHLVLAAMIFVVAMMFVDPTIVVLAVSRTYLAGPPDIERRSRWNGATDVASWRALGGSSAGSLQPLAIAGRQGFETRVNVPRQAYVAVQALAAGGQVLGQSATAGPN